MHQKAVSLVLFFCWITTLAHAQSSTSKAPQEPQEKKPAIEWGKFEYDRQLMLATDGKDRERLLYDFCQRGILESTGLAGLYPVGEGAGYAGGIVSAALDGLRAAKAIIRRYAPLERG